MKHSLVALLFVLGGCGWKSDGLARLEELYPTPAPQDAGSTGPIDIGTPMCSGYSGTWAVRLLQNSTIAPLGDPWKMTLSDLFIADGTSGSMDLRFCNQDVSIIASGQATDLGRTKVPDALKSALYSAPLSIPLPADGTFHAEELVWLWGIKNLTDPKTDPLPTKDDYLGDPRVFDQDNDTNPGVTMNILVPLGDRYMVRRAVFTFGAGKLTLDNQWLTGALTSTINESALGASNMLLLTPAPITVKTEGTVYQFRCVGRTYTCASLANDHQVLFRNAPN